MKNNAFRFDTPEDLIPASDHEGQYCLHCGNEIPHGKSISSKRDELFCCSGCNYVFNLINSLGLDDFYELRDEQKITPVGEICDQEFGYLDLDDFKKIYKTDENDHCMRFYINGISCAACLWLIEKTSEIVEQIDSVSLNMSSKVATVRFSDDSSYSKFPETLKRFGYSTVPVGKIGETDIFREKERKNSLYRIGVAGVCAGNVMLLSAAKYAGASGSFASYFDLISLLLSIPVITYCSYLFYKNSYYTAINKRPSVDIPVVFVVLAGWTLSVVNFFEGGDVYFDSITLFVFLLLVSRYMLNSISERINRLSTPASSLFSGNSVELQDEHTGDLTPYPVQELKKGDLIRIKYGERVPADGFLSSHSVHLNLSVLTGESIPQYSSEGDYIYAGSISESDELLLKVDKPVDESRIGCLISKIEDRNLFKCGFSGLSDRYSTIFTSSVALISVVSFFIFHIYFGTGESLRRIIAFVLISCPCAFVFTLPLSMAYSVKTASEKGLIIKDLDILEKVKGIKNIFFDKTGTLTKGNFNVLKWDRNIISDKDIDAIVAIEKKSAHPVARSVVNYFSDTERKLPEVSCFQYIPAKGIKARIGSDSYEIISGSVGDDEKIIPGSVLTKLSVYRNKEFLTSILLGDEIKGDVPEVLKDLRSYGIAINIISGDRKRNVISVASELGIPAENVYAEMSPEKKIEIIRSSENSMMVGDGINDAGAISEADVGVSIQGSLEESLRFSDVYLLRNDLTSITDLLSHSRITGNSVLTSIVFSLLYNISAGTLALLGYINPLLAAVLMPASSTTLFLLSLLMQRQLKWSYQNK